MAPYSIACSTCGARLKVRDSRAIGELSLCPKCGSMVMITPPSPGGAEPHAGGHRGLSDSSPQIVVRPKNLGSDFEDAAALFADTVDDLGVKDAKVVGASGTSSGTGVPPVTTPKPSPKPTPQQQTHTGEKSVPLISTPPPIEPPAGSMSSIELDPLLARAATRAPLAQAVASAQQSFDLQPVPPTQDFAHALPNAGAPAPSVAGAPMGIDDRPWASPTQQLLRRYGLIGGAVVAAIVVVGLLLTLVFSSATPPPTVATPTNDGATAPATIAEEEDKEVPVAEKPPTPPTDTPTPKELTDDDLVVAPPTDEAPATSTPSSETPDTSEAPDDEPADGDAPPLFVDDSDPPPKPDGAESTGDEVADVGLGEFAPLVDAFPIPPAPERTPTDIAAPADEPEAAPQRQRPAPLAVDVAARLADPIDGIDTGGSPLVKFLELMSQLSTIPITLPPESLAQVQATATSPVSIVLRDANVEKILEAGLAEHQLKFEVQGEQIIVKPAPKREAGVLTVSHPVEDLAADAAALESLAAQLRQFVAPEIWDAAGGEAKIDTSKGKLEIRGTQEVQFDVHVFCQKLRVARGLAPRSKLDPSIFALASRNQRSAAKLSTPVRAIFHAQRPLTRILNHLEKAADVTLLVDWQALLAAGWPPHTMAAILVDDQPLATALDELLTPMDLAYRAIDENTVQITSRAKLETYPELEFYSIAAQIEGGAVPEKLMDDLKAKVGKEFFVDAGGAGEIALDEPSKCLIVRLPQLQQRTLEAELKPR